MMIMIPPPDGEFRERLHEVLERSGLSMRALSGAMGRDVGYVAALLDPSRPSRARPTPADLLAASDATGIAFVELLESLWGIERSRLAGEVRSLEPAGLMGAQAGHLTDTDRRSLGDFAAFLAARRTQPRRR
jgi:transcriptional regulator with XRE-family HTH domain